MTPRTPSTAAGRALAERMTGTPSWMARAILAIEAEARAPLNVERLARALHNVSYGCQYPGRPSRADAIYHKGHAAAIAREYAALEEPPPGPQYTEDDPDWSAMVSPNSDTP